MPRFTYMSSAVTSPSAEKALNGGSPSATAISAVPSPGAGASINDASNRVGSSRVSERWRGVGNRTWYVSISASNPPLPEPLHHPARVRLGLGRTGMMRPRRHPAVPLQEIPGRDPGVCPLLHVPLGSDPVGMEADQVLGERRRGNHGQGESQQKPSHLKPPDQRPPAPCSAAASPPWSAPRRQDAG